MVKPSCEEIQKLSKDYKVVPISKEIYADVTTPIILLRKIAEISEEYYLLESIEGGEKWGRYSFLGFDPAMSITCRESKIKIKTKEEKIIYGNPFEMLPQILEEWKAPKIKGMPPFTGGLVGYFSYGMAKYAEPTLKFSETEFMDMDLMLFDKIIAYDHLKQKIIVIVNMKTDKVMENYGKALGDIEKLISIIRNQVQLNNKPNKSTPKFQCNVTEEQFTTMVEETKKHIYEGNIFQGVISRRFEADYEDSLMNPYRILRTTNPSPYMVYLKNKEVELISTSPETLVRLIDGKLHTFPIAGSRPRGLTEEEDKQLEEELLTDEKELAEHNMLVDLARNDIGRIAKFGSVAVTEYKKIHKYSKIMHITSAVEGIIKEDKNICDIIASILPAGTLSGAPKIKAMEIIEQLEKTPRGIYGGALGYIDFSGNLDLCIAIRMAVKKDNKVYVQAGAGIVADSVAKSEYEESENKAKAVMNAIINGSEVDE